MGGRFGLRPRYLGGLPGPSSSAPMGGALPTASYYGGMRLLLVSMGGRRPYNYLVTGGISLGNPRDPFSVGRGIVLSFCLAVPLRGEDGGCWWVVLALRTAT